MTFQEDFLYNSKNERIAVHFSYSIELTKEYSEEEIDKELQKRVLELFHNQNKAYAHFPKTNSAVAIIIN